MYRKKTRRQHRNKFLADINKALGRGSEGALRRREGGSVQCVYKKEKKKEDMQKFGEELREKSTAARERISFARGKFQQSAAEREAGSA